MITLVSRARFFFVILLPQIAHGLKFVSIQVPKFQESCYHTDFIHFANANSLEDSIDSKVQLEEILTEISFPFPTGLLITENSNVCSCLLQQNVVSLRPSFKKVFELRDALSSATCSDIIEKAEHYAAGNGGWTSDRHTAYPTTDLPLEAIFGKFSSVHGLVNGNILPQIASFFDLDEEYLNIGELFVAKYEHGANKQAGLGAHVDGTPWSFVVSLNDPMNEFTGGGTHFVEEATTYRPTEIGNAVIFSGKNKHEGVRITSGVRYILTGFCNYANPSISGEELKASFDSKFDGSAFSGQRKFWTTASSDGQTEKDRVIAKGSHEEAGYDRSPAEHMREHIGDGVRIGDILKAIWIFDDTDGSRYDSSSTAVISMGISLQSSFNSDQNMIGIAGVEKRRGRFVTLDGLNSEEIKKLVALSGKDAQTYGCSILVKSDNRADEDDESNEEQRNIPRIAWKLLSTGKYWSYDDALLGSRP